MEEYWNIGYRHFKESDSVADGGGRFDFKVLKADKRYWFADPFLFKKDGLIYLFVEMFDNKTEKGLIGVSEWDGRQFSRPRVVLEEEFHLSYPYVFERGGEVYMMPETMQAGCIQLYRAVSFPDKWEKDSVLLEIKDAVDTVIMDNCLLTSVIDSLQEKTTHLELYDLSTGEACPCSPINKPDSLTRGAGRPINHKGVALRPAQNSTGGDYGKGVIFYKYDLRDGIYAEEEYSQITAENIRAEGLSVRGLHTYARCDDIEIVDLKAVRTNLERLLWIIQKKI